MPKMNVIESIHIDATPNKIFPLISNLNHWDQWSPWVLAEPTAKITVAKEGNYHEWDGDIIGAGNLSIVSTDPNASVTMALNFLKPWKSSATTHFHLHETKKGTHVEWTMDSSLPFFLFWMKKQMQILIGMDYQRGLTLLKDLVENDSIPSTLQFKGVKPFHATNYIGLTTRCPISEIPTHMEQDYTRLMTFLMQEAQEYMCGYAFTIYHKWELTKDRVQYTACHPVNACPPNLPKGIVYNSIPKLSAYTIRHTGPYRHIGNAWAAGMMHQQAKCFRPNKKFPPLEVMYNSPKNTPENELVSEVLFPVR